MLRLSHLNRPHTPTCKMAQQMPAHHPSWAINCALVVSRRGSLLLLLIHSPQPDRSLHRKARPNQSMEVGQRRLRTTHMARTRPTILAFKISLLRPGGRRLHLNRECQHLLCLNHICNRKCLINSSRSSNQHRQHHHNRDRNRAWSNKKCCIR